MTHAPDASRAAAAVDKARSADFPVHPSAVSTDTATSCPVTGAAGPETELRRFLAQGLRDAEQYEHADGSLTGSPKAWTRAISAVATLEARLRDAERLIEAIELDVEPRHSADLAPMNWRKEAADVAGQVAEIRARVAQYRATRATPPGANGGDR